MREIRCPHWRTFANRQRARDRHRFPKVATGTADNLTMLGVGRDVAII
jgi:hypothetical protein